MVEYKTKNAWKKTEINLEKYDKFDEKPGKDLEFCFQKVAVILR